MVSGEWCVVSAQGWPDPASSGDQPAECLHDRQGDDGNRVRQARDLDQTPARAEPARLDGAEHQENGSQAEPEPEQESDAIDR